MFPAAREHKLTKTTSVSSFIAEASPRNTLEFAITSNAARIFEMKMLHLIALNKMNGLGSQLQAFLEEAKNIKEDDLLLVGTKERLKNLILSEPISELREAALRLTRTPHAQGEIRAAAWSVFQFTVMKRLGLELADSIPNLIIDPNDLYINYIGKDIFNPNELQKSALRNYIIAFTYLQSEHELKDNGSFIEAYKDFLPDYCPDKSKTDFRCIVQ
jgi:hypothetical protein